MSCCSDISSQATVAKYRPHLRVLNSFFFRIENLVEAEMSIYMSLYLGSRIQYLEIQQKD